MQNAETDVVSEQKHVDGYVVYRKHTMEQVPLMVTHTVESGAAFGVAQYCCHNKVLMFVPPGIPLPLPGSWRVFCRADLS